MKKINIKTLQGTWIKHPEDKDIQLRIRPFSLFTMTKLPTEKDIDYTEFWEVFNYCIVDWKGFVGENDKALKCDEENKKFVFDYDQEIVIFATEYIYKLREDVISVEDSKN